MPFDFGNGWCAIAAIEAPGTAAMRDRATNSACISARCAPFLDERAPGSRSHVHFASELNAPNRAAHAARKARGTLEDARGAQRGSANRCASDCKAPETDGECVAEADRFLTPLVEDLDVIEELAACLLSGVERDILNDKVDATFDGRDSARDIFVEARSNAAAHRCACTSIVLRRRGTEFAQHSHMRTLLGLPIVIVISACVADVEDETQGDENVTTEEPGDMPSYDDGRDPGDPCAMGLAFDDTGELLSVPTECVTEPEVDDGDPPPDAEDMSEHSTLPH